jgi:hypothetical protein
MAEEALGVIRLGRWPAGVHPANTPDAGEIYVYKSDDDADEELHAKYEDGSNSVLGLGGGGSTLPAREEIVHTTASLAHLAEEDDQDVELWESVAILKIEVDRACRVRIYADAASRTADLDRDFVYPATDGQGVYMDFQFDAAGSRICAPQVLASDMKTTPDGFMPIAVQNRSGATATVEVTLTILRREVWS